MMTVRAGKLIATAAGLLVFFLLALYLRNSDPGSGKVFLPRCGTYSVTGLYCPGCGSTRASYALLHGDVWGAVQQNVFFVVALPFLVLGAAKTWYGWVADRRVRLLPFRWKWSYSIVIAGALVAFTILRNIPVRPFAWLAPVPVASTPPASGSSAPVEGDSLLSGH